MRTHRAYLSTGPRKLLLLAGVLALVLALGAPAAFASDPVFDLLDDAADGGTVGVYLKEVNGPVIIGHNQSFVFEPASTIKALIHFHAMRQVQDGAIVNGNVVTLTTQIPWFAGPANYNNSPPPGTSCPDVSTLPGTDTLQNGLQQMMGPSDNRWTQAMRDFFGDANIVATRQVFNMNNTALNHLIGCGGPALANPNQLTLVDAGRMYEAVATGFLDDANRAQAFALMTQDNGTFNNVIDAEAAGLGLSAASINSFKAQRQSANKAGSYGLSDGQYRSVAGWAQIPWKSSLTCEIEVREYVYGAFIHQADSIDASFIGIRPAGVELFREELRAALESWADCEADLQITSTIVVDPPAQMDVNTPTVLTVRVAMRNNGPAGPVDALLTRTTTVPADCEINPTGSVTPVPAMPHGVLVVQEMDFMVECSQPSFHLFRFDSSIASTIPAMVDPDPTNNTGVAQTTIPVIARADLAITGWDFSALDEAGIQDLLVGQDFLFSTTKTLHNFGDTVGNLYNAPVDAVVTKSVEVPDGIRAILTVGPDEAPATITVAKLGDPLVVFNNQPAGTVIEVDGPATVTLEYAVAPLAISVDRQIIEGFGIHCLAPGEYDLTFHNSIVADDPHVVDPDPSNNDVEVVRTIECAIPVQINIRPGNAHNFVNPKSNQTLPVAILTTEAGEYGLPLAFDATTVHHASARFGTVETLNDGGGSAASPDRDFIRDSFEMDDKTKDGDLDMVLLVSVPGSGIEDGTMEACVVGTYLGDDNNVYKFFGCDVVTTKP